MSTEVFGDEGLGVSAGEAFVSEDDLSLADEVVVVFQHGLGDFAFTEFRVGQGSDDRHALSGGDQVEPEAPDGPGAGGAVAVTGIPCQIGAFDCFPGCPGRHWGGVAENTGKGLSSLLLKCRTPAQQFRNYSPRGSRTEGSSSPSSSSGLMYSPWWRTPQCRQGWSVQWVVPSS